MDEQGHRKVSPDRPSDASVCGSKKKKKNTLPSVPLKDTLMEEKVVGEELNGEQEQMEHDCNTTCVSDNPQTTPVSYKASLLGFNGVENGGANMDEDELLSDVFNKEWEFPELTEELKELMKHYPVVPVEPEEYSEMCKPWNTTLIITVLGRKYNVYTLKILLPRIIAAHSVYNVVYEGLDVICFSCGRYGHRRDNCPYT